MTNTQTQITQRKSKILPLFLVVVFVFIAAIIFFSFQNSSSAKNIKSLNTSIKNTQSTIDALKDTKTLEGFQRSAFILEQKEKERIQWSQIVPNVLKLQSNVVSFSQFTIDPNKNILINGETRSINNVSALMKTIKQDKELSESFVSNIKINEQSTGPYPVSFTISFESQ